MVTPQAKWLSSEEVVGEEESVRAEDTVVVVERATTTFLQRTAPTSPPGGSRLSGTLGKISRGNKGKEFAVPRTLSRKMSRETIESIALAEERKRKQASWLIDPRKSKFVGRWDGVTGIALLFTALFTPYEISYMGTAELGGVRFVINRLVDLIFMVDLVLQFFLMYSYQKSIVDRVRWVDDQGTIAKHYLKSWFGLDIVSVLPFWILDYTGDPCGGGNSSMGSLLRVVRLMRCIKMIRLVRASRLVKRWQAKMPMSHGALAMIKCLVAIALFGHWFACIWTLQTSFASTPLETWLGSEGCGGPGAPLCVPTPGFDETKPWGGFAPPGCEGTPGRMPAVDPGVCQSAEAMYITSIYLAIVTITSVGYGDTTPTTPSETVVLTFLMMVSALMWGLVIATFSGIFSTMNPADTAFRNNMDEVNTFMRSCA